jgi:hypothetical protein
MIALKGKPDIGDKINTQIIQPLIEARGDRAGVAQNLSCSSSPEWRLIAARRSL